MFAELPTNAESIPEVQQCRFLKRAMPPAWQDKLGASGVAHDKMSELIQYFERIEMREKTGKPSRFNKTDKPDRHKGNKDKSSNDSSASASKNPSKWCSHHQTSSHNTADCFALKKQRKDEAESESSDDDEYKFIGLVDPKSVAPKAPLRVEVQLRKENKKIHVLLDSGASKSVINAEMMAVLASHGRRQVESKTTFQTVGGQVKSNGTAVVQFRFPHLNPTTKVTHRFAVLAQSADQIVIGRDLVNALGLVLNFKEKIVQWDGYASTLYKGPPSEAPTPTVATDHEFPDEYKETVDTAVRPTDLMPEAVSGEVAARYLKFLEDYAHLYDGHLGRMRFDDYVLPLSPDFKPVHAKPYAIPCSVEDKTKKENQRLVNQDVLEQIYGSEMASPAFFLVKQNGTLRLLIDFRVLNKYLRRSPYYVPKIREILLQLAGAKCLSSFDANIGYYA
ncbi:Pol Polyprotein, partial [Phytophthora megakarya]